MFNNKEKKIVVIRLKAQAISAYNCYLVYGMPSPFTFWGFAHTLTLKLDIKLKDESVLPLIHFYENRMNQTTKCFNQLKSSQRVTSSSTEQAATISDIPRADIDFSIMFEYEVDSKTVSEDAVKKAVLKLRFGGGTIVQNSVKINIYDSSKPEKEIFSRISRAYLLNEKKITLKEGSEIEDYLNEMAIQKGKKGWNIPSLMGYSLIEEPQERANIRFGYKHAFAEPFIGVISVTGLKKYGESRTTFKKDSWKFQINKKIVTIKQGK